MSPLYRLSLEYAAHVHQWRVHRCWKVDPRWADRVVDVDRKHSPNLRLRLLTPYAEPVGAAVLPHIILRHYWQSRRHG